MSYVAYMLCTSVIAINKALLRFQWSLRSVSIELESFGDLEVVVGILTCSVLRPMWIIF